MNVEELINYLRYLISIGKVEPTYEVYTGDGPEKFAFVIEKNEICIKDNTISLG